MTDALRRAVHGERGAGDHLMTLVYDDLRQLARNKLSTLGPGQTLQTTALVHEAWMRIAEPTRLDFDGRAHFFGAASRAMRNILVDQARRKATLKRDGKRQELEDEGIPAIETPHDDMLAVDESLDRLEDLEPRKAQVVMLRFFTGLSMEAVAEVLDVSLATVERDWRFARAWLQDHIEGARGAGA